MEKSKIIRNLFAYIQAFVYFCIVIIREINVLNSKRDDAIVSSNLCGTVFWILFYVCFTLRICLFVFFLYFRVLYELLFCEKVHHFIISIIYIILHKARETPHSEHVPLCASVNIYFISGWTLHFIITFTELEHNIICRQKCCVSVDVCMCVW